MGMKLQMSQVVRHTQPVDATSMHEWEADPASRFGAGLLFWCWYLPADVMQWRSALRAAIRALAKGRALLTYPSQTAPARQMPVRSPVRPR
jgi:hypothetical protein